MFDDVLKHSEKITINVTFEDYERVLSLAKESGEPIATVAKKLMLEGLDAFDNPVKKAFSKMRG